ncbi:sodium-dependent transporter [Brevibacillus laterosporus]|uniref:sodium-dependent transporter n=1 Tax=Brevibacillus laterosporus TaxID=1465 RepID=UPI0026560EDB|nr:sodium-dependent transporter [Brevibacillus laterosporus]MDN9011369.1 sodium-dependent transporter [Brevibacillus laterosporus]MDO0942453.1 sodium-dependent transporter [Brevibacillus laterosporus]
MSKSEQWTSKLGFILAAAGSAIGLGAIWKFPYVAGTSGGGAFFLLFLLFTLLLGTPLLLGELIVGRSTGKDAVSAYKSIAPNTPWHWVGRLGIITCFILLSFYSVVGGWILLYFIKSITGQLLGQGLDYNQLFGQTISDSWLVLSVQFLFMMITILVVSRGVSNGIEKANKYMMPALFLIFLALIVRSVTLPGAWEGIAFFLQPNFGELSSKSILYALGQAFFSLSVGVSVMVTFSSYLPKNESLPKSTVSIVSLTIVISLLAGLAIFPAVFSLGMKPTEGPGLLFVVLPAVFDHIPFGAFFLTIFLLLFLFATLTSAFSMLEISVAAITKGNQAKRASAAWKIGLLIFVLGIPSALAYGVLSDLTIFGKSFFDAADFLVSNILMPLGALLISIFVAWKMKRDILLAEVQQGSTGKVVWFKAWYFLLKYIVPIAIIVVFISLLLGQ